MTLPTEFSPWEHLQSVLLTTYNREVREEFQGEDDDSLSTPRSSLKLACTIKDSDSAIQSLIRMMLFYWTVKGNEELRPNLYTIPTDAYQQMVRFAPQVTLYFLEDKADVDEGYSPIDMQISFRLMGETEATFTPSNATALATKIRTEFGGATPYRFHKGRIKLSYTDMDKGYVLRVHAFSESEGKELIGKILDIQGHVRDDSKLTINTLGDTPPITPPLKQVYGKQRRSARKRPVGYVRFRRAEVHLHGMPNAIVLLDYTGRSKKVVLDVL